MDKYENVKDFIKRAKTDAALLALKSCVSPMNKDVLILLENRYRRYKSDKIRGIIKDDTELNHINSSLLNFIQTEQEGDIFYLDSPNNTTIFMTNDYSKNINISNSPGAIANMADYMENITNNVNQNLNSSTAPDEVKELVKQLTAQIAKLSAQIDQPKAETMGKDVKTLSEEMATPQPRKSWYKVALESIKETALTIGEIAKPVLDIIGKLSPLLIS